MNRILTLCLLLALGSVAFAQDGPTPEAIAAGQDLFQTAGGIGCVACHGAFGLGDLSIGPDVRGVDATRIVGALEGAEEMDFLLPLLSDADIDSLATYLDYLGTLEPVSTLFRSGTFDPAELTIVADSATQLIVANGGRSECTFAVDGVEIEPIVIGGRSSGDVVLTLPAETGALQASCVEAPDAVLTLTIEAAAAE
jgi:cytochrome c553